MNEVAKTLLRFANIASLKKLTYANALRVGAKEIERLEKELEELKDNINDYAELCESQREEIEELERESMKDMDEYERASYRDRKIKSELR